MASRLRVLANLSSTTLRWLRGGVFLLCLLPLARLVMLGVSDGLGANPVEFVIRALGSAALTLLCLTLAVTPLRWLTGWIWLVRLRRMLGLYAFFYALLHLLAFAGIDQRFDLAAIGTEILKRPYITIGMTAFVLLIPLAATSTHAMVRRLGALRWQRLHRLVYLIAPLAVLHFLWLKAAKNNFGEPLIYAGIVALLLGVQLIRWLLARTQAGGKRSLASN